MRTSSSSDAITRSNSTKATSRTTLSPNLETNKSTNANIIASLTAFCDEF